MGDAVEAELDLRGELCPYTFLKAKLALEELDGGQGLRVIVDDESSARDVPRTLEGAGHAVLAVETPSHGLWVVVVRKRG